VLVWLALVTAFAAAVRSTWSPCGLSMLSTITPLAEQGRGHRYWPTAAWFVAGATVGGATLGLAAAAAAAVAGALDLSDGVVIGLALAATVVTVASDLRLFGFHLPIHARQVDELWLGKFRSWVYGAGFGWQIGSGFATYIMTGAVYLTVGFAVLTGEPLTAFAICTAFGICRGLAILLGATITSPERLVAFHRRFDALGEPVRRAVAGEQLMVLAVIVGAVAAPVLGVVAVVVIAVATAMWALASWDPPRDRVTNVTQAPAAG
jgi:hypothetical protein